MKPEVLLVADTYYPKVDGTLKFMEEFCRRAGSEFTLRQLVPKLDGSMEQLTHIKESFRVDPSRFISLSGYSSMKFSFRNLRRIKEAIAKTDLVFIQGPAIISYLSMYYGKKMGKKTVTYMHVLSWELLSKFLPRRFRRVGAWIARRVSRIFLNMCDAILVPYKGLRDQLQEEGIRVPIEVTKLGVDIRKFTPARDKTQAKKRLGIKEDTFVVGFVGRVSAEKNIQVLKRAFRKLSKQENLHLLIVGSGPQSQVEDFTQMPNCTVTGFVDNVEAYLQAMDVFVMPSLTETTSLATLEAMACATPVIASKVGFLQDYVVKNYNGVFFPRNSATMLSVKLRKMREDDSFRQKLGSNARKTVAYAFSWERSINRIKKILHKNIYS